MTTNKPPKKEVIYFPCETQLKEEFYKLAVDRKLSPSSLLRAFMRKFVKDSKNQEAGVVSVTILDGDTN